MFLEALTVHYSTVLWRTELPRDPEGVTLPQSKHESFSICLTDWLIYTHPCFFLSFLSSVSSLKYSLLPHIIPSFSKYLYFFLCLTLFSSLTSLLFAFTCHFLHNFPMMYILSNVLTSLPSLPFLWLPLFLPFHLHACVWIDKGEAREQLTFTLVSLCHDQNHFGRKKECINEKDVYVLSLSFCRNLHSPSSFAFLSLLGLYSLYLYFFLSLFCCLFSTFHSLMLSSFHPSPFLAHFMSSSEYWPFYYTLHLPFLLLCHPPLMNKASMEKKTLVLPHLKFVNWGFIMEAILWFQSDKWQKWFSSQFFGWFICLITCSAAKSVSQCLPPRYHIRKQTNRFNLRWS